MRTLRKILYSLSILSSIVVSAQEPYDSIHTIAATPYYVQDAYIIMDLISSHNAAIVIDVDSPDGGIARLVAQQAGNLPSLQKIYAVGFWRDARANKNLFHRFLSNVKQENTGNLIIPIRMRSKEAALALNVTADFITVVGDNDANTIYKEIIAWFPHLSSNGIIAGNNWYENNVQMGVANAAAALNLTLKIVNNVWYFQKNTP